ncbi:conjugal transfer protein TraD [Flavisphingomonas formosensis]|uniref:conjugal transfer protein TraD n=1 Tax=Flavisphingomonas formosensis TaxID=861534 RepID=UPI0012F930A2|nr:conjugal transfer protein TraD [Sphingomonas formosensis]
MRKPRDYAAELRVLDAKAKQLKAQRIRQLGELVIACRADGLGPEQLAGALLAAKDANAQAKEAWRQRGAAFFRGGSGGAKQDDRRSRPEQSGTLPFDGPAASDRADPRPS